MNYNDFKAKVMGLPLIFTRDLMRGRSDGQPMLNQVERWHKRGLITKLKRGIYVLNKTDRKLEPSMVYIANQLYSPSYVSLEYALGYYDLIPERVSDVTSVSTKKTAQITNEIGVFIYQHLKSPAFRGFTAVKDDAGLTTFIAGPEKAIVDFVYLNLEKFKPGDTDIFTQSYRFQNMDILKEKELMRLAGCFSSKKLIRVIGGLARLIKEEGAM